MLSKHHAASVNQTVAKTSAGASEHLPVAKVTNIASTLEELKEKGDNLRYTENQLRTVAHDQINSIFLTLANTCSLKISERRVEMRPTEL